MEDAVDCLVFFIFFFAKKKEKMVGRLCWLLSWNVGAEFSKGWHVMGESVLLTSRCAAFGLDNSCGQSGHRPYNSPHVHQR